MTLPLEHVEALYRFIHKILNDHNCRLIRIGGIQNHVHLLVNMHQDVPLSLLIRKIKSYSSGWMRKDERFRYFGGWGREYYAASISATHTDAVEEYIKNQLQHHFQTSFDEEIERMCQKNRLVFDNQDLR